MGTGSGASLKDEGGVVSEVSNVITIDIFELSDSEHARPREGPHSQVSTQATCSCSGFS